MRIDLPDEVLPADRLGRVHLIGIGGAGLSAIALLMHESGVDVTGSDARDSAVLARLRAAGIVCHVGHAAEHLADRDTVVASTAVPEDNPEVIEARRRGLRLWPRSAGLMSTMLSDRRIAVAGTHGKTTTTAMLTFALRGAGADPSFAIGAEVAGLGTNARRGAGPEFVVEADESDGAFLHYRPYAAVVTNIDADHLDTWGTVEAYEQAFADFAATVEQIVAISADDPGCRRLVEAGTSARLVTAGFAPDADVRGTDVVVEGSTTRFTVSGAGLDPTEVVLAVPGRHYAADALLALAIGIELGHDPAGLIEGLGAYTGAARRMEPKGEAGGVRVVDSYAHHPTEIAADLAATRALAGGDRLVVVFQPHLVSRTRLFGERMGHELAAADLVVVADLYLAREAADPEVTSDLVVRAAGPGALAGGPVQDVPRLLATLVRPGDLVLTLGAGDVTTVGPALLELLRNSSDE
ncbi:UDP-N-acetylmuramate--L-alanine ligase [Aeromicrobium duanguangcaii]|uniref:UDP-N-acetylmuramate--L-alanine ligase n=1 Tax=Aeromicrobium duanguangcaii TaxID=2968086 RepID=A0ABY5KGP9_9ACTN|nr:UDP-N-acetylmuramate--L-alanine ligase [Aeromicrobium duanguangcaii]MCD9153255.1 UDP-N-acetylmuramate--L-alanine ligase [Aeromicrobium duanguangcaii]UUI69647.1 UDP-N-acetylmuramate--L-alanine ligase [Aeromicrobium duanguangcaii]